MPDLVAIEKIRQLNRAEAQYQAWLEEEDAAFEDEQTAFNHEKTVLEGDELAEAEKAFENIKSNHEKRKAEAEEASKKRAKEIESLKQRLKVSVDDERDYTKFDDSVFKKDFVKNDETANNISSTLSAMVSQIELDNQIDRIQLSTPVKGNKEGTFI